MAASSDFSIADIIITAATVSAFNSEDMHEYAKWWENLQPDVQQCILTNAGTINGLATALPRVGEYILTNCQFYADSLPDEVALFPKSEVVNLIQYAIHEFKKGYFQILVEQFNIPDWFASKVVEYMPQSWMAPLYELL